MLSSINAGATGGKKSGSMPLSLSASYTSTIGEQLVALLRKLHVTDAWNSHINYYINDRMSVVANLVLDSAMPLNVSSIQTAVIMFGIRGKNR